ncbi:Thiamine pyrophosphate-requiring enzymes [hydrothermal vent metagenome]|uniref:Thiamine pyrophosphate-requiring enzymes n=1 Tax=hydrothermal vent metagenome TaxID=652676 RepID=A0A3B0SZM6_9ZZZZ
MKKETAARCLVRILVKNSVEKAFCVPGESYLSVLDALYDAQDRIELITCRQESGAGNMAEAHGKLTGRPGICFVTRGPGATNASIAVHTAFQDSTPMVLFIGQVARNQYDREAFQEVDYRQMFGPLAKWVGQIDRADRMVEYVTRAFHVAMSGRPGPVVLALPEDMLTDEITREEIRPAHVAEAYISPDDLKDIHYELSQACRPLVLLGGSGWDCKSVNNVQEFIQKNDLPVAVSFRCQDLFDNRLDNYIGDVGIGINPALAERVKSADVILCLGPRLGEITTGGYSLFDIPCPGQKLIMVHSGAEELGHVYRPHKAVNSSMKNIAHALSALDVLPSAKWSEWQDKARTDYLDWHRPLPTTGDMDPDMDMGAIYDHLRAVMPDDAILTNGAGNYTIWLHRFMTYKKFRSQLAPTSGAMGYGLPAAIAAKVTHPERPVVCFTGDGCFMMTAQELATAAHHKTKLVILLFNNSMYGTIRMHQEKNHPDRVIATELTNPDFAAFARSFGLRGVTVRKTPEFAPAFDEAMQSNKTTLIEIIVDKQILTPTMTLNQNT